MGLTAVNFEPGSMGRKNTLWDYILRPGIQQAGIVVTASPGTDLLDGVDLMGTILASTALQPFGMYPAGICIAYTDAAGSGATVVVEVRGRNQFGDPIVETMTHVSVANGEEITQSLNCFLIVDSITVVSTIDVQDTDDFSMGSFGNDVNNRVKLPLPYKGAGASDIISLAKTNPGSGWAENFAIENIDPVRHTFDMSEVGTAAEAWVMILDPVGGVDIR